jgi:predicted dehydrogenase
MMRRRQFLRSSSALLAAGLFPKGPLEALAAAGPHRHIRVAIIGHTGKGNYGHGIDTVWLKTPGAEIVGVADPDPAGLAAAQKRLGAPRTFADFHEMLAEVEADVVAVCPRQIGLHHEMLRAAIQSGARGIYMEKPFVRTPAEADDIVRLCLERNVKLALAHRNRYHPALKVVADMVGSGELGTPLEIRARGKEDQRGGGLDLWVLGSHVLNLATVFAGPPKACSASIFQQGRPAADTDIHDGDEGVGLIVGDEIQARFEMESGVPLFFASKKGAAISGANFGLQVVCTGGIVDLRIDSEPLVHVMRGHPFKPVAETRVWVPLTSAGLGTPEPLANIRELIAGHRGPVEDLLESIEGNREPLCGPEAGRTTIEMIQATFASHRLEGGRVTIPLANRQNALAKG